MKTCQTPASAWQPLWVWTTAETIRKSSLCWRRASGRLPHALRVCSIEALFTRIAKGKGMPHINPVVDLGNAISLKYTLPLGAHDLGDAGDDIQVRLSRPEDTFLPFGSTEEEAPDAGEVVYAVGSQGRALPVDHPPLFLPGLDRLCGQGPSGNGTALFKIDKKITIFFCFSELFILFFFSSEL